jgi:hypothetical protein
MSKELEEFKKEKAEFKRNLSKLFTSGIFKIAKKLEPGAIIVTTALEGFDYIKSNEFFDMEENRSYPRDIICSECQRRVVMSNWMFAGYQKNLSEGNPNIVICNKCFLSRVNITHIKDNLK